MVTNFFDNDAHIYVTNCYEEVMSELCKLNVLNVCLTDQWHHLFDDKQKGNHLKKSSNPSD